RQLYVALDGLTNQDLGRVLIKRERPPARCARQRRQAPADQRRFREQRQSLRVEQRQYAAKATLFVFTGEAKRLAPVLARERLQPSRVVVNGGLGVGQTELLPSFICLGISFDHPHNSRANLLLVLSDYSHVDISPRSSSSRVEGLCAPAAGRLAISPRLE